MAQRKYDSMQFTTKCLEFYYFTEPKLYSKYILQRKRNEKKAKWLSEEALQIAEKRREAKGKGKQERIYPFKCRAPKNNKERKESLPQ